MTKEKDELFDYYTDLATRHRLLLEWRTRHPDWESEQFEADVDKYYHNGKPQDMVFVSSFDPLDVPPSTADVFTVETLLNIMAVALQAWEKNND